MEKEKWPVYHYFPVGPGMRRTKNAFRSIMGAVWGTTIDMKARKSVSTNVMNLMFIEAYISMFVQISKYINNTMNKERRTASANARFVSRSFRILLK